MTKQLRDAFLHAICLGAPCSKCPCLTGRPDGRRCSFDRTPDSQLAQIARECYVKRGRPEKLDKYMTVINAAYPAKAIIL